MPARINARPSRTDHRLRPTIGGVEVEVRLVWRERLGAWFMDVSDATGAPLLQGKRVTPATEPWRAIIGEDTGGPQGGALVVVGRDPYYRSDLNAGVDLLYLRADEVPDDIDPTDGLVATVI